jgi:hypothetical protein
MANPNPPLENLKKGKKFKSDERARIIGSKGGKQLGENNKKRKTMRELTRIMLDCKANERNKKIVEKEFPDLNDEDLTNSAMLLAKVFSKASKGDIKAFEVLRDTSGQTPIKPTVQVTTEIPLDEEDEAMMKESAKKLWGLKD